MRIFPAWGLWVWAALAVCRGAGAQGPEAPVGHSDALDAVPVEAQATPFRQWLGVEVTGTAIVNPKARERLPLSVIERRDIERSGATTLLQVLNSLSMAHNSTDEGQMIAAAGGAIAVGLRGEPNSTLVLLNGVRLPNYAQYSLSGEASSAHLRLIPLAAVERIEVLREGASTLYGSDAVAGVVNIITRTDVRGLQINARQGLVARGQGDQGGLELSWGHGDFDRDGYQWLVSAGRQRGRPVLGSDRPTAWWPVTAISNNPAAAYTWPGNRWDSNTGEFLPHPQYANGVCEGEHLWSQQELGGAGSNLCFFDETSLQNVYPSEVSTSVLAQGRLQLGGGRSVFVEHAVSRNRFAYNWASNPRVLHLDSASGVWHYLSLLPAGTMVREHHDRFVRTVAGLEGQALGLRYKVLAFDGEHRTARQTLRRSDEAQWVDVFTPQELSTPAHELGPDTLDKMRSLQYTRRNAVATSESRGLQAQLSGDWAHANGLESQYALAAGWRAERLRFESIDGVRSAVDEGRRVAHVLGEWAMPLNEALTMALGARADRYSDAGAANTAKVSARYKANDRWMWRGALGNGFRAPGLMLTSAVNDEVARFPASVYSAGRPVIVFNEGNPALQPERSQHLTLGTQFTGLRWAVSLDWWALHSNQLVYVPDWGHVLQTPALYARHVRELPAGTPNPDNALGMFLQPQNLARRQQQGVDYAFRYRQPLERGVLRLDWSGSVNLLSRFDTGDEVVSDLGRMTAQTARYTPRHKWALSAMWEPRASERHRLTLNYLSGHQDVVVPGWPDRVPSHWTLDWHSQVALRSGLALGVGISNITNRIPPRRLSNSRQSAAGVDTRYGDFRGRTLVLSLDARL